jgi:hypothetical protein
MSHLRQQIRERVASTLTGLTTTGSNIFQSRIYPMEQASLPGLIVYSVSESTMPVTMGAIRDMDATLTLAIEAYAIGANLDDSLDTICKEVQVAMYGDRTVNSLAKDLQLDSTTIVFAQDSDVPAGYATMNWSVNYQFAENNPEVAI